MDVSFITHATTIDMLALIWKVQLKYTMSHFTAQHFLYIYGISIFLGIKAMLIRMTYIKIFETPMSASKSICILMLNDLSCSINAVLLLEQCNLLHLK